jgi:hypothetical protein
VNREIRRRSRLIKLIGIAAIVLDAASAHALGDFSFRAELDKTEVLLGDEITLKVVITQPSGEEYVLPENPDFGKLKLIRKDEKREVHGGAKVTKTVSFVLAGYEMGEFTIAAMPVLSPEGDTGFKTEEFKVKIVGQLKEGEQAELKDVAPPVKFYERTWIPLYVLGAIAALVGLVLLLRRYLRRKREAAAAAKLAAETVEKRRPAHELALEAINALLAEDLLSRGQHRVFHFRISEIIREYVGARFAFDSLEMTTTELVEAVKSRYTAGLDLDEFAEFCSMTDLVKFAKHLPTDSEVSRTVDMAFSIVKKTAPSPEAAVVR